MRSHVALAALVITIPNFAPRVLAQQPAADSTKQIADTAKLGAVIVRESGRAHRYGSRFSSGATKTDTPLRDTPQSVSLVTRALISEQAMQGMQDALRFVPGVTMAQGEGHRDAPVIRGQSTTADFFVDGVRDDAQYLRDLYNVERVELLGGSNAMIFGRGGGGGVVNRVVKKAQWDPTRDLVVEGGSFAHVRGMIDAGGALSPAIAARVNGMSEHSDGFRDRVALARLGVNPSLAVALGARALARVSGEYFEDRRVVDRGIPSFRGVPSAAAIATFFGNPDSSRSRLTLNRLDGSVEHQLGGHVQLRHQARVTSYAKFYQNVFPGAVDTSGAMVNLSAYNNMHDRTNAFAQSEATLRFGVRVPQTTVVGVEGGRQATDNFRRTGYFNGSATTIAVPFDAPTVSTPVAFRQSATDADNDVLAGTGAVYVQHQVAFSPRWQATLGARAEHFAIRFENHRSGEVLRRSDDALAPRAGLVFKPASPVSVYTSLSVSYLPSAGDQFSSLTATTQTLEPERFTNREVGLKWDVTPALSLTTAAYRLDRTNTQAPDPNTPGVVVQTGRQRSAGIEATVTGSILPRWDAVATYSNQTATILSRTSAAAAGARVPLVPRQRMSLWNRVAVAPGLALGAGAIQQGTMFAAIDNTVRLPGFWRFDGAAYLTSIGGDGVSAQVNVENVLNSRYYATSQGNNNIMPGAPRTVRVSVTTRLR